MPYPKMKYHKTEEPMRIENVEEEELLGEDWKDSPADFGVITHPSPDQQKDDRLEKLRTAKLAALKNKPPEEEDMGEQGNSNEEQPPQTSPRRRR